MTAALPRPGDIVLLTRTASVQFAHPIALRVIRVHDWSTYQGWCWLDGYQLDTAGNAVARRTVFVQIAGLRPAPSSPQHRPKNQRPTAKAVMPPASRASRVSSPPRHQAP